MSEQNAISLAKDFSVCDEIAYRYAAESVENLLEQGYTPEEALMLSGIGGYEN